MSDYKTIKVPSSLMLEVDNIIKNSNYFYTSRTDVIKDAVRLLKRSYELRNDGTFRKSNKKIVSGS